MTPIKVLPSRTEDLAELPISTQEDIRNSPCAHGAAENEPDSNPALRAFYKSILTEVGEDPQRIGLLRTPHRAAKAMEYLTSGYSMDIEKVLNGAIFEEKYDEMVVVRDIDFFSMCEHHMPPFYGKCHVAYIPDGKIVGLSKIPRIVDVFARRLQVQERMTRDEALKSMTIWAAYAGFMEKDVGSLEPGKYADFVVLDQDIMQVPAELVLQTRVLATYLGGSPVYERKAIQ